MLYTCNFFKEGTHKSAFLFMCLLKNVSFDSIDFNLFSCEIPLIVQKCKHMLYYTHFVPKISISNLHISFKKYEGWKKIKNKTKTITFYFLFIICFFSKYVKLPKYKNNRLNVRRWIQMRTLPINETMAVGRPLSKNCKNWFSYEALPYLFQ